MKYVLVPIRFVYSILMLSHEKIRTIDGYDGSLSLDRKSFSCTHKVLLRINIKI